MSTQRPTDDQIVGSGTSSHTIRSDDAVISSSVSDANNFQSSLSHSVILNGKEFVIIKQLARSGESEVYLVTRLGGYAVLKYYYSNFKPKDEILIKLKMLKHPDIVLLYDYGYYQSRFYEISEYAQGGTLLEYMPVTSLDAMKQIVAEIIEALYYCHSNGIIHRDIKPDNIYFRTKAKKDLAIGDFGISSLTLHSDSLIRTTFARTSIYAAPELFTNIQGKTTIDKSIDYYALGITVLHLWLGENPFKHVDEFGIMRLKSEGRITIPPNLDAEIAKLIKGLITVNPLERWSYQEVKQWLVGVAVPVHYQDLIFNYKPYSFGSVDGAQIIVKNPKELAHYLEKYPEKGEGHLYRNTIAKWVEPVESGLFNELMDVVERDYPQDKRAGLKKATYILDPEKHYQGFDGSELKSQEEIALHYERHSAHYQKELSNPNALFYLFLEARHYKEKADQYRGYFTSYNPELALNMLILNLQGAHSCIINGQEFYQPEELLSVPASTKASIIEQLANQNSKLSLWMSRFPKLQPTIDLWRKLKRFDTTTFAYAFQLGFDLNGNHCKDKSEFYQYFKQDLNFFISAHQAQQNLVNAHHWLANYCQASLPQIIIDYLSNETYQDHCIAPLLRFICESADSTEALYQNINRVLAKCNHIIIKKQALANEVVTLIKESLEKNWKKDYQRVSPRFLQIFDRYITFVEANLPVHAPLFNLITTQVSDFIAANIRKDVEVIKTEETFIKTYFTELQAIITRIKKIAIDFPYLRRFNLEQIYCKQQSKVISQKNNQLKLNKIENLKEEYKTISVRRLEIHQLKQASDNNSSIILFSMVSLVALGLILLTIFKTGLLNLFSSKLLSFSAFVVGAILGWHLERTPSLVRKFATAFFCGIALIGIVESFFEYYTLIPLLSTMVILFLIATMILFGGWALLLYSKNAKSVQTVVLDNEEKKALKQSTDTIEQHFAEKEAYEILRETIRIMLLNDKEFEQEFPANTPR
ncbi:MAG: protein kinase [Methylacidiphilales bacterium]|nr:protein kinase [Candidatus Methylacidiphilales bacterium]